MKQQGQKLKLFRVKHIVEEYSDDTHPVTVPQIKELLEQDGVLADRKGLYEDLRALEEDLGMDIVHEEMSKYYTLMEHDFTIDELKILIDTIATSRFLTEKASRELIAKLERYCSKYQRASLNRQFVVQGRPKTENSKVHYWVDAIFRAINEDCQISFSYGHYNSSKELYYYKDKITVSPWQLLFTDNNYYLLAYNEKTQKIQHYRVDRMNEVILLEDIARIGKEAFEADDMADYTKYIFSMYKGEKKKLDIIFPKKLMDVVIDRFGKNVWTTVVDKNHFSVTTYVSVSPQFFGWLAGLGKEVRISNPVEVQQEYVDYLKSLIGE